MRFASWEKVKVELALFRFAVNWPNCNRACEAEAALGNLKRWRF